MKTILKTQTLLFAALAMTLFPAVIRAEPVTVSPQELATEWSFFGEGTRAAQNRMFYMEESPGSSGVMVFSPEVFAGDVTVRYEIMPMNPASICVALLFATDKEGRDLRTLPAAGPDTPELTLGDLKTYFFAFHNVAHNRKPFLARFPGGNLMEIDRNLVRSGQFHQIEVGRKGKTLWLEIDGERIIEVEEPEPFPSGHIGFRLRGISQMPAAALIRNVTLQQN
ncbi:MAG: hypothetical protein JJU05_04725 [Verrucomicrobia bacterium]|nr:hypothetical protein [Verrucomicrobiota bacterium]MCH8526849.1 hypothetical protein [Kiritimatiellia bacterium]